MLELLFLSFISIGMVIHCLIYTENFRNCKWGERLPTRSLLSLRTWLAHLPFFVLDTGRSIFLCLRPLQKCQSQTLSFPSYYPFWIPNKLAPGERNRLLRELSRLYALITCPIFLLQISRFCYFLLQFRLGEATRELHQHCALLLGCWGIVVGVSTGWGRNAWHEQERKSDDWLREWTQKPPEGNGKWQERFTALERQKIAELLFVKNDARNFLLSCFIFELQAQAIELCLATGNFLGWTPLGYLIALVLLHEFFKDLPGTRIPMVPVFVTYLITRQLLPGHPAGLVMQSGLANAFLLTIRFDKQREQHRSVHGSILRTRFAHGMRLFRLAGTQEAWR